MLEGMPSGGKIYVLFSIGYFVFGVAFLAVAVQSLVVQSKIAKELKITNEKLEQLRTGE